MPPLRGPGITRGAAWGIGVVFAVGIALNLGVLALTSRQITTVRQQTRSDCAFYRDLAGLPVSVSPKTGKAAKLGVAIIAHSREAWRGHGCGGTLPPPDPSFARWAKFYGLPYR
jgi:hypothetical protein